MIRPDSGNVLIITAECVLNFTGELKKYCVKGNSEVLSHFHNINL